MKGGEESIGVDLIEASQDESKTKGLGVGMFGWVPRRMDSSVSMETSNDQHLSSEKVQGVHLLMNKKEVFDEEKKENRKDDDEVEQEKDVYDKLLEAMETGDGELQDEMLDQILEEFDSLEKAKKDKKKGLEVETVEPRKGRKKTGLGTKGKGRGRAKGRGR